MQAIIRATIIMIAAALFFSFMPAGTIAAEPEVLSEAVIQAYLEKNAVDDPGSCLVDDLKVEILGISDVVPGRQTDVYYKSSYPLRCNRRKESKEGQEVLRAGRLRNGNWIDRETWGIIAK
jgi:hypothetical protein